MRRTAAIWLALGVALAGWSGWSQTPGRVNVPHLVEVEAGVWRGGQPTMEGWRELRALGITNVVKLNLESEGSDAEAKRLGMRVYAEPIPLTEQFGLRELAMTNVEKALAQVPAKGTYIHCEHGQDRTGLAVAIWRVERDGWSKDAAEKEMLARGFHKELAGLWRCWRSYKAPERGAAKQQTAP